MEQTKNSSLLKHIRSGDPFKEQLKPFMPQSDPCPYCGKICKPRGLGPHLRLKHGIKVKIVAKRLSHLGGDSSHLGGDSSHLSHSSERIQRPGDYVKKKNEVIETIIETVIHPNPDLGDFERVGSCWEKDKIKLPTYRTGKCTLFVQSGMKGGLDIYRRKDCPMEKRSWGGLWACECLLPITNEDYRSECKYLSNQNS